MAAERGLPTKLSVLTSNPADRFCKRKEFILEAEIPEAAASSSPSFASVDLGGRGEVRNGGGYNASLVTERGSGPDHR